MVSLFPAIVHYHICRSRCHRCCIPRGNIDKNRSSSEIEMPPLLQHTSPISRRYISLLWISKGGQPSELTWVMIPSSLVLFFLACLVLFFAVATIAKTVGGGATTRKNHGREKRNFMLLLLIEISVYFNWNVRTWLSFGLGLGNNCRHSRVDEIANNYTQTSWYYCGREQKKNKRSDFTC